jgi:hypothetical protein
MKGAAVTWTTFKQHLPTMYGIAGAVVLTTLLIGTETGREALGWIYLQHTQAIEHSIHFPFPLDRLDPTCPQCM